MALRKPLGCLLAALAVTAWTACKDKGDAAKTQASASDPNQRCERLAKACGDSDKHVEKIIEDCKQAATEHVDKGCTDKVIALYDCYEKELCGKADKIWAFDDLRVLADRNSKCVAERNAARACAGK
jgi:hypothetical protein